MELSDQELLMTQISAFHLSERQGMELYKKSHDPISQATYYRIKGRVNAMTKRRLVDIAKELPEEHLKTLDKINLIEQSLVEKLLDPDNSNIDSSRIAKIIVEIQPYKSAYQEGAKFALQELEKRELEQKDNYLSILA